MAQPSPVPVRFPSGISTDFKWGPLADFGRPNPFGYNIWSDDFNYLNPALTATKTNAGTIAVGAAAGGVATFTTGTATTDNAVLSLPVATFQLTLGKKAFFLTRFQLANALNPGVIVGLLAATTTPFTGTPANGIWISSTSGSTGFSLSHSIGGVITTAVIPSTFALTNATNVDIGFYVDRQGNVSAFVGPQLVGWLPQSGVAALNGGRGAVATISPPNLTTAILMPVVAVLSGTAAAAVMSVDFAMAAVER